MNKTQSPLQRVRLRWIALPIGFMAFIGIMAALLNSRYKYVYGLSMMSWLARYEGFHIAAHLVIFGLLVLMIWRIMRTQRYIPVALGFVVIGTLIIEVTQFISRQQSVTRAIVEGSFFDLGINLLGAACAMILVWVFQRNAST